MTTNKEHKYIDLHAVSLSNKDENINKGKAC